MKKRSIYKSSLQGTLGVSIAAALTMGIGPLASSDGSGTAGAAQAPVKIGFALPLTGPIAPGVKVGLPTAQARIKYVNAHGGANGHQLQLVTADTQSTPQGGLEAAQSLVSKGVAIVIEADSGDFDGAAAQYVASHGIPIIGSVSDPSELSDPMLFSALPNQAPSLPNSTDLGLFEKKLGVTKIAGIGWGSLAISAALTQGPLNAASHVGVTTVATNLSATPTTTDYTAQALSVKSSGAQGTWAALPLAPDQAFVTALQQQGVKLKGIVNLYTLYEAATLSSPNIGAFNGSYVKYPISPMNLDNAAVKQFKSILTKYAPGSFGGYNETVSYLDADLAAQAIGRAKGSVTPSAVLTAIRTITHYTGEGLLPSYLDYAKSKSAPQNIQKCNWYVQIKNGKFALPDQSAICGTLVK